MIDVGYYTQYNGKIEIKPAANLSMHRIPPEFLLDYPRNWETDVKLATQKLKLQPCATCGHSIESVMLGSIVPNSSEAYQGYNMQEHIQQIVDILGPSFEYCGSIDCVGEDGKVWKFVVRVREVGPIVVKVNAKLVFEEV